MKKGFFCVTIFVISFWLTGIFLPAIISSSSLPVSAIIVLALFSLASGIAAIVYLVKKTIPDCAERDNYEDHIC